MTASDAAAIASIAADATALVAAWMDENREATRKAANIATDLATAVIAEIVKAQEDDYAAAMQNEIADEARKEAALHAERSAERAHMKSIDFCMAVHQLAREFWRKAYSASHHPLLCPAGTTQMNQ